MKKDTIGETLVLPAVAEVIWKKTVWQQTKMLSFERGTEDIAKDLKRQVLEETGQCGRLGI